MHPSFLFHCNTRLIGSIDVRTLWGSAFLVNSPNGLTPLAGCEVFHEMCRAGEGQNIISVDNPTHFHNHHAFIVTRVPRRCW